MVSSYAKEIAQKFSDMVQSDREYLRSQLRALQQFDPVEIDQSDWLFHSFVQELRSRNVWIDMGSTRFKSAYRKFSQQSKDIRDYLQSAIPKMTRVEKIKLGGHVAKLLADDLSKWAKLSLDAMIANAGQIPALLDKELPGYGAAGWMCVLVGRSVHVD